MKTQEIPAYDWMVKYTPQTEWIQRRGILLWLAFFFIELGAGTFILASFFNNFAGLLAGWLICSVLGGGLHLLYLGKPWRTWRMLLSSGWKTSWISRGLAFVGLFLLLGLILILVTSSFDAPLALIIACDILALLSIIYAGFAMNFVNGIPLWNTLFLPALYVVSGLWGGAELTLGFNLLAGSTIDIEGVEFWIRILLIGFILLVPAYLISIKFLSEPGGASVRQIVTGRFALVFWVLVVVVGILIPTSIVIISLIGGLHSIPTAFYFLAILSGLAGDLTLRYLILRCGFYAPLISTWAVPASK